MGKQSNLRQKRKAIRALVQAGTMTIPQAYEAYRILKGKRPRDPVTGELRVSHSYQNYGNLR